MQTVKKGFRDLQSSAVMTTAALPRGTCVFDEWMDHQHPKLSLT